MFSLQRLFGKGDKFFDLLEASAVEAQVSARSLVKLLKNPTGDALLEDFVLARRKEKRIAEQISEELVKTFVTGLEREDIEALSNALYKIPKTVERFAERYSLCAGRLKHPNFALQAEMIEKATDTLIAMVKHLRKIPPMETMKELNDRLQFVEGEADKLMLQSLRDLYNDHGDPIEVIVAKDLNELLEKVIDRCRDAGNVVTHIVLKNS
jgi:uncharacterized protein Yka (UPF0111/DUF47 family)